MKILQKYILKETSGYFLISLIAFTGVLLTVRILKLTSLIINKGVDPYDVAMVFLAIIPTFLEVAVPMATLLGLMLAFARLSGDSEIVVIRASGISLAQLLKPVIVFGLLATALSLYISIELRPWGYQTLKDTLVKIAQTKTTAGLDAGLFNPMGKLTFYMEQIDHKSGNIKGALIDDKRADEKRQIIIARSGNINSDPSNKSIVIRLNDGTIHEKADKSYSITEFDTNYIRLKPDDLLDDDTKKQRKRLREVKTLKLYEYEAELVSFLTNFSISDCTTEDCYELNPPDFIRHEKPKKWGRYLNQIRVEIARRFSLPCASLLLGLIAMPLGIQPPRLQKSWGASISLFLGLVIFAFYFGAQSIGSALGESGIIPAMLGAWLPNFLLGILAIIFIQKMSTEKWQSIAHGVERFFVMFKNIGTGKKA